MATARVALDWLRANLGLGEDPPGSNTNFITEWFGMNGQPWCAMTVSRALNEAFGDPDSWQVPGVAATYAWGTAYVPALRQYFEDAGLYDQEPRVGDVVIFGWSPGSDGDHTGLVEQVVGDGTVVTLEGNIDNELGRRRRSMAVILGFGHPPYDTDPQGGTFMALTDQEQKDLLGQVYAISGAAGRLEVAVRDSQTGVQAELAALNAKVDKLAAGKP